MWRLGSCQRCGAVFHEAYVDLKIGSSEDGQRRDFEHGCPTCKQESTWAVIGKLHQDE